MIIEALKFLQKEGFTHLVWDGTETTVFNNWDPFPDSAFRSNTNSRKMMNRLNDYFEEHIGENSFTLIVGDKHWDLLEKGVVKRRVFETLEEECARKAKEG